MIQQHWTLLLRAYCGEEPELPPDEMRKVYVELHGLASRMFGRERTPHTLQPTALVHEALLRLLEERRPIEERAEFVAACARAMRRILVDRARRRRLLADCQTQLGREPDPVAMLRSAELLDLDDSLEALAAENPDLARLVELRWFLGCTTEETAAHMDLSTRTVKRRWALARAWLQRHLEDNHDGTHPLE